MGDVGARLSRPLPARNSFVTGRAATVPLWRIPRNRWAWCRRHPLRSRLKFLARKPVTVFKPHPMHAARNNAAWCDSVCRAHGRPGEFQPGFWINRQPVPRFYPNVVTTSTSAEGGHEKAQLDAIHALLEAGLPGAWCVKDSFCLLDLAPLGFRILFEAQWVHHPPARPRPGVVTSDVRWLQVRREEELVCWEAAWAGSPEQVLASRTFPSALLEEANVAVWAGLQGDRVIAGLCTNRTGEGVGVSNLFVSPEESEAVLASGLAALDEAFPGIPFWGYESGPTLDALRTLDFHPLGPVRVWIRDSP